MLIKILHISGIIFLTTCTIFIGILISYSNDILDTSKHLINLAYRNQVDTKLSLVNTKEIIGEVSFLLLLAVLKEQREISSATAKAYVDQSLILISKHSQRISELKGPIQDLILKN